MTANIRRALLSVYDKTGIVEFAGELAALEIALVSTGGTARALRSAGLEVSDVSEVTGFPEMLDGRVKTLHPKVHGGLLFRRDVDEHLAAVTEHGIEPIDLVVINLYPFEETTARPGVTFDECIEQIDIGGPAMLRSAAKNHAFVTVVCNPARYGEVLRQLRESGGTDAELRWALAVEVFARTAAYDRAVADWLQQHSP